MLLKYINSNRITLTILFLLLPVVYWIPSLVQGAGEQLTEIKGVPFGRWIVSFNENFRVLASILALLLIITNGYLLIQLNTVHIFIPVRTQLPLFFYIALTISITQLHHLTPALIASTILIFLFYRIFSSYRVDRISINFLDAGLLLATASLFYLPAIFFFPFLLAGMILIRPFQWREWVFAIIGLCIPYAFVMSGYYLLDIPLGNLSDGMSQSFNRVPKNLSLNQIINWSYVLLLTAITSYYIATAIDSMKIHARKFFLVFLVFFLVALLIFLIVGGAGISIVYFAAIPLSYLFSHYFVKCRRNWINDLLFAVFVLLLLWQRIL
jgi:Family of unknown function (DUF6427)